MDNNSMFKIVDIRDNIEDYKRIVSQNPNDAKDLDFYYDEWVKAYCELGTSLITHNVALSGHISSLKTPKIDPYIAGGATNGVLGAGAGVMAGVSAAARNAKIDEDRKMWGERELNNSIRHANAEDIVLQYTDAILKLVQKYPEGEKIHLAAMAKGNKYMEDKAKREEINETSKRRARITLAVFTGLIFAIFGISMTDSFAMGILFFVLFGAVGFIAFGKSDSNRNSTINNDPPMNLKVNGAPKVDGLTREVKENLLSQGRAELMNENSRMRDRVNLIVALHEYVEDPEIAEMKAALLEKDKKCQKKLLRKFMLLVAICILVFVFLIWGQR